MLFRSQHHADRLAEEQPRGHCEADGLDQRGGLDHDAGVGEREQRHDAERDPGVERVFNPFERRHALARGHRDRLQHVVAVLVVVPAASTVF